VCCLHDHDSEYRRHLTAFFTEGLHEGLRVAYIGPDDVAAARAARGIPNGWWPPVRPPPRRPSRRVPWLAGERGRHRAGSYAGQQHAFVRYEF
jgi:hypothetical protein